MCKSGGGEVDGSAGGKFNHDTEVVEDEMTALGGVKVPQCLDDAPPKGKVLRVPVGESSDVWREVECCAREDTSFKVPLEARIVLDGLVKGLAVVGIEARCKGVEVS